MCSFVQLNTLKKREPREEQYLIFQCLFGEYSPAYLPHMFMCICQNFLIADETLRNEIEVLLSITKEAALPSSSFTTSPQPQGTQNIVDGSIINEEDKKEIRINTLLTEIR